MRGYRDLHLRALSTTYSMQAKNATNMRLTLIAGRHSRRHAASQIFVLSWRRNTPVLPATEMTLPVLLVAVSAQWSKLAWLPLLFWQSVGRVAVIAEAPRY